MTLHPHMGLRRIRQPGAEKAGFFAIASAPSEKECFDFLIKEAPPSDWSPGTSWLTGASAGTPLEMSQVMGSGFKIGADALSDVSELPIRDWLVIDTSCGRSHSTLLLPPSRALAACTSTQVDSVVCFAAGSGDQRCDSTHTCRCVTWPAVSRGSPPLAGISPIRSAIESGMLKGKKVSLYYGARTPAQMAYQHKFESWKVGVTSHMCC